MVSKTTFRHGRVNFSAQNSGQPFQTSLGPFSVVLLQPCYEALLRDCNGFSVILFWFCLSRFVPVCHGSVSTRVGGCDQCSPFHLPGFLQCLCFSPQSNKRLTGWVNRKSPTLKKNPRASALENSCFHSGASPKCASRCTTIAARNRTNADNGILKNEVFTEIGESWNLELCSIKGAKFVPKFPPQCFL